MYKSSTEYIPVRLSSVLLLPQTSGVFPDITYPSNSPSRRFPRISGLVSEAAISTVERASSFKHPCAEEGKKNQESHRAFFPALFLHYIFPSSLPLVFTPESLPTGSSQFSSILGPQNDRDASALGTHGTMLSMLFPICLPAYILHRLWLVEHQQQCMTCEKK
jgi:hypothetical protein